MCVRMNPIFRCVLLGFLVLPLSSVPVAAESITIGDFFYDTDPFFGPSFGISNVSDTTLGGAGGAFTDLTLNLFKGSELIATTDFGTLEAGSSIDSLFLDLSSLVFDSARLALTFSQPGQVSVDPLASIVFDGFFPSFTGTGHLDAFIQFTPVPEPGTLLLVSAGLAVLARQKRWSR